MKISTKLALLIAGCATAFLGFAYCARVTIARVKVNGPEYAKIADGKELVADILPPPAYVIESYLLVLQMQDEPDKARVGELVRKGKELADAFDDRESHWAKTLPEGPVKSQLVRSAKPARQFFEVRDREFYPAVQAGNAQRAREVVRQSLRPLYDEHKGYIDELVKLTEKENTAKEAAVGALVDTSGNVMLALSAGIAALLVAFAVMTRELSRSLTSRIGVVAEAASKVAEGDLTVRLESAGNDELGRMVVAVGSMTTSLGSLVGRVKRSSIDLLSTATQIAAASKEQEVTMRGFSASATDVAAASREISATNQELLATMQDVTGLAEGASREAGEGQRALGEMDVVMAGLADATSGISQKLTAIRERAGDINTVVVTITKVADQTNLLSVNAAIEAEKAGEYGRGFLVLAREIRRLADQTAVSTLDIDRIVRTMQTAVTAGVMEMDKFSDEMRRGRERVGQVATQMASVIAHVQRVMAKFEDVSMGMKNQSEGARQISTSMAELTEGIKQVSASLREFNMATTQMREAVDGLKVEVARYRVEG